MGNEVKQRLNETRAHYSRSRRQAKEEVEEKRFPLSAEPALIHPQNTSIVKVRDNGMVDIFVGTDNGIRVDPNERTISAMANRMISKSRYTSVRTDRERVVDVGTNETKHIGNHWTVNVKGNARIQADGVIDIDSGKAINMAAPVIRLSAKQGIQMTPFPAHLHPEYQTEGGSS